jgi:YD repeat-containing protein
MKTRIFFQSILVATACFCLLFFATCKKDDNPSTTTYRTVGSKNYDNGVLNSSSTLNYNGEKLVSIMTLDDYYDGDSSKTLVSYPDDQTVFLIDSYLDLGSWYEENKTELQFEAKNLVQEIFYEYFENAWQPETKYVYQYENGILVDEITYYYWGDSWTPVVKTQYEYNGENLKQSITYMYSDDWYIHSKDEYSYNGSNLARIITYSYSEGNYTESSKMEFAFNGSQMLNYQVFDFNNGVWNNSGIGTSFTYDEFGNVKTWESLNDDSVSKVEFTYEEGKGNVKDILYFPSGVYGYFPWPTKKPSVVSCQSSVVSH